MNYPTFVLASASPARRRLLQQAGIEPLVWKSDFDESQIQIDQPEALVGRLARCKAETVANQLRIQTDPKLQTALVLGCDSVLALDGEIYGKPETGDQAIARWQQMRGRSGVLHTGHALIDLATGRSLVRTCETEVYFAAVSARQIAAYVATGEPLKCAGCFALEGRGSLFIDRLVGCYTNVIGLSMPLLREMLIELGYEPIDFWAEA